MSKGKILIVDDEPEIVKSIWMRLKANDYDVVSAMDGMQATNTAIRENPDLIILDIGLPGGSGHIVVDRLRANANTFNTPVIYLTARTSEEDYKQAVKGKVEKYLTKPFKSDELLAAIEEILTRVEATTS
ncbi:MAG: response regulator transcription factor [bacterium]|nr:response regulator transcription factor [bacterium]